MARFSEMERVEVWDRWEAGDANRLIGRDLGRSAASIRVFVESWGGVRPQPRTRSPRHLSLLEREEISRGVAAGMRADGQDLEPVDILGRERCDNRTRWTRQPSSPTTYGREAHTKREMSRARPRKERGRRRASTVWKKASARSAMTWVVRRLDSDVSNRGDGASNGTVATASS